MRELMLMAEGKVKQDWNVASHVMTLTANIHRDPKKGRAFKISDFNPFITKPVIKKTKNFKILKDVFVTKGKHK